jgi:hypothetical protein
MTTTCTITKAGRCDTYGRPLLVGQSYTSSDDEIRSLWQAGFCSVTDAPTIFDKPTYPYPQQIACIGTPFVIIPGDGASAGLLFTGSAGAFTLSAAIVTNAWNALKGCWCYMPSGFGRSGYAAGWYWGIFSSDTAGVLYSDTYVSGRPVRDFSPTAFPVDLSGRLTQTTSEVTGPTGFTLVGGAMGPSGVIKSHVRICGNTTGTKTIKQYLDSSLIATINPSATPNVDMLVSTRNQASDSLQLTSPAGSATGIASAFGSFPTTDYAAIDTTTDKNLSFSLQISTNTACAILLHADVTVTYGA